MKKRKMILLLCVVVLLFIGICGCAVVGLFEGSPTETTPPTQSVSKYENPMGLPEDMLDTLVEYLEQYNAEYDIITYSEEETIDFIKNGAQPLHVAFDPADYYFVCGYYHHSRESEENNAYCCVKEYTWVKFASTDKIRETYLGKELIVAFQMNRALFVKDLLANEDYSPGMEHFQIYKPKFEDGVNTNPPIDFSETFIYLNGVTTKNGYSYEPFNGKGYRSVKQYNHRNLTFRCIYFEGQYYIPVYTHKVDANGEIKSVSDNARKFGKYYDTIESIMETGRYSIENETYRSVEHYGLVSVDDFANEIIK